MKKHFSLIVLSILAFLPLLFTQSVLAADPTPSLTNSYCDFSGGGVPGQSTGNVTITSSCAVYENETGVSGGNLIIDGGVVTLHKKLGFSTTGQIEVVNSGIVYVNTGGEIIQGIICVKDADNDHYADTVLVTTDPYGVPLTTAITQIEQKIYTTPGCPDGYTSRTDINNLTIADTDFTSIDTAKVGTSDRELLRLGFTVEGIRDALAAASDIQIIDKNLLVCNGGVCPTTDFGATFGNIYTAGKIGVGITNPANPIDVTGNVSLTGNLGVGLTNPAAKLQSLSTTEQLRLSYNASNYDTFTTSSIGQLTIATVGTNPNIILSPGGTGFVGVGKTNPTVKLDVTGDLNISGNTNICELQTYTAGSGTVTCTAGYYTWAGVASATGGQMLCCKVRNPI